MKNKRHRFLNRLMIGFFTAFVVILIQSVSLTILPAKQLINTSAIASESKTINQINDAYQLQVSGRYRQACGLLLEALELSDFDCTNLIESEFTAAEQDIIKKLPASPQRATVLINLGNIFRIIGALQNSEIVLNRALEMADTIQEKSAVYLTFANTQRALGKREEIYQNPAKARQKYYKNAADFYQKAIAISDSNSTKLSAQLNYLNFLIETENKPTGITALWQQIYKNISQLPASIETNYQRLYLAENLACLHLRNTQKKPDNKLFQPPTMRLCAQKEPTVNQEVSLNIIKEILETAYQDAQILQDVKAQSYALGYLGELYEINQQTSEAKVFTERALKLANSIQSSEDIAYRWEWQLGRIYYQQKNREIALTSYSKSLDNLQKLRKDLVAIDRDVQFNFRDEVEPIYREYVALLLAEKTPTQENLQKAREVIEALQLAELEDFFREACLNVKAVKLDEVEKTAAVIYPFFLEKQLEIILYLPGEKLSHYRTFLRDNFQNTLTALPYSLQPNQPNPDRYKIFSTQVYQWLFPPELMAKLQSVKKENNTDIKTLVFVLDGLLRNIPISALYDEKNNQFLIQKYAVAIAPSLQLLDPKPLQTRQPKALIAGVSRQAPSFNLPPGWRVLSYVKDELQQVRNKIYDNKYLSNEDFTATKFLENFRDSGVSIVHLATHGKFSSQIENTFILDWNQRINIKQLNRLLQNQNQNEPVELLVLSACETAQGDNRAALGLAGVAVRAGARSTMATLWTVNDKSTANFMRYFYRYLIENKLTKAEALRQAQLTFLQGKEQENFKHPRFWAAFVLVGNWL